MFFMEIYMKRKLKTLRETYFDHKILLMIKFNPRKAEMKYSIMNRKNPHYG